MFFVIVAALPENFEDVFSLQGLFDQHLYSTLFVALKLGFFGHSRRQQNYFGHITRFMLLVQVFQQINHLLCLLGF